MKRSTADGQERFAPRWLLVAMIGAAALAGCSSGSLCDPGQTYANGVCEVPDGAPITIDANPRFAHFGDVCGADADCPLPTAYCAKQPAAATGYCTGVGCLADPTVCPPAWSCLDLSVYQAGLPAICTSP